MPPPDSSPFVPTGQRLRTDYQNPRPGNRVNAGSSTPISPCPKCHRIDQAEEEEQSGSSRRWFVCNRCGIRYPSLPHP